MSERLYGDKCYSISSLIFYSDKSYSLFSLTIIDEEKKVLNMTSDVNYMKLFSSSLMLAK